MLPQAHAAETILAPELADCVESRCWFVSGLNRDLVKVGLNDFVPNYFHQIPRLCRDFMEIGCVVTTVSPMDKAGYFTFGLVNDYTSTAAHCAERLIVEVNENMPRVFGDSLLHISEVDAVVENHVPLPEVESPRPKPEAETIGKRIAELVPDGATLQVGYGALPDAVTPYLEGHRDLGIHTEVFGDALVRLIRRGAVTGRKKTLHPGKHVFTVALSTKQICEFLDDNPSAESYPVSYTNDPAVIAQNDNMVSINSIIEVDLLGQCNAEHMAGSQFSGTGGQLDFVRGAFNSRGGKSILAFYSTAKNGTVSRVVPRLETGAIVTTPRMDAHYLVTEYGAVNLKGKTARQRALDIISIAHPDVRDDLLREAEQMYIV
jgi:itaconate CoA-transferase